MDTRVGPKSTLSAHNWTKKVGPESCQLRIHQCKRNVTLQMCYLRQQPHFRARRMFFIVTGQQCKVELDENRLSQKKGEEKKRLQHTTSTSLRVQQSNKFAKLGVSFVMCTSCRKVGPFKESLINW